MTDVAARPVVAIAVPAFASHGALVGHGIRLMSPVPVLLNQRAVIGHLAQAFRLTLAVGMGKSALAP